MVDNLPAGPILIPHLVPSGTQKVEVRNIGNATLGIEPLNLLVQHLQLIEPVGVAAGWARGRVFSLGGMTRGATANWFAVPG